MLGHRTLLTLEDFLEAGDVGRMLGFQAADPSLAPNQSYGWAFGASRKSVCPFRAANVQQESAKPVHRSPSLTTRKEPPTCGNTRNSQVSKLA